MAQDNYSTIPLQASLDQLALRRAGETIQRTGLSLPCQVTAVDGSIVTVQFEVSSLWNLPPVTVPKAESQWVRSATQIGDFGVVVPADASLGGISALGVGVANAQQNQGNLSNLVWVPVGALTFPAVPANVGANRTWINGLDGAGVGDTAWTTFSLHDGTTGYLSVVAPASSGRVCLGGLASVAGNIASTRAVVANADLNTLINDATNGVIAKTLQTLATAMGAASVTAATGASSIPAFASAFSAILSASGWVKGLSGIEPTIPACSSIVRVIP